MSYENFERLCKLHGVKPGTVARESGISTATITSWKQGKYTPKQDKLQKLADQLQVPLSAITGQPDPEPERSELSYDYFVKVNGEYEVLFELAKQVPKDSIERIAKMMELLIKE